MISNEKLREDSIANGKDVSEKEFVAAGQEFFYVSGWMEKTEDAENVAQSINVQSVYPQTSVPTPVVTVRSTHGAKCSAEVRKLNVSVKPTISAEAAKRGIGMDRTKTVIGAGSQLATAQPHRSSSHRSRQ